MLDADEKRQCGQLRSRRDRPSPQSDNDVEDQAPLRSPAAKIGLCGALQSDDAATLPRPGCAIMRIRKPLQPPSLLVFARRGTNESLDSEIGSRTERDWDVSTLSSLRRRIRMSAKHAIATTPLTLQKPPRGVGL